MQKEDSPMMKGAEIGVMLPQARNTWGSQNLEEARRTLPWRLQREHGLADTLILDVWPPE